MVMKCVDCGASSAKTICPKCLAARKPCANKKCTTKLNPKNDYVYCKSCACSVLTCRNPHRPNTKLCELHKVCKTTGCDNQQPSKKNQESSNKSHMWPKLFVVADLAKTIVRFLPWGQYIQWIIECKDNDLQTNLCNWQSESYRNNVVKKAIIVQGNRIALQVALPHFDESDYYNMLQYATPDILEFMISNITKKIKWSRYSLENIPLVNLAIVASQCHMSYKTQSHLIQHALKHNDKIKLTWMLHEKKWQCSIKCKLCWTDELWSIVRPSIVALRLMVPDLSNMPLQMLSRRVPRMSVEDRQKLFCKSTNPYQAAILWLPEFDINDYCKLKEFPKTKLSACEATLQYIEDSSTKLDQLQFKRALYVHLYKYVVDRCSIDDSLMMFEQACGNGWIHTARFIWNNSDKVEQETQVSYMLDSPTLTFNQLHGMSIFEFALEKAQYDPHFDSFVVSLHHQAHNLNDVILWKFLISKKLFCTEVLESCIGSGVFAVTLGARSVEFVSLLWPTHKYIFDRYAKQLLACALDATIIPDQTTFFVNNIELVKFLCQQDGFDVDQELLCKHIAFLAECDAVDVLRKIKDTHSIEMQTLCYAYLRAHDIETIQTLWNLEPYIRPDSKVFHTVFEMSFVLRHNSQIPNCHFFLEKKLITPKDLYARMSTQQHDCDIIHNLFASLYFDFDGI